MKCLSPDTLKLPQSWGEMVRQAKLFRDNEFERISGLQSDKLFPLIQDTLRVLSYNAVTQDPIRIAKLE